MKFRCNVGWMRFGPGLWMLLVFVVSCEDKDAKVTRAQCSQVADHIASVIMDHYASHPDELWGGMKDPYETGIPRTITKASFATFLATQQGKTWQMQRLGQVRSAAEAGIEPCVEHASPALVRCLLAVKTRDDVAACDKGNSPLSTSADDPGGSDGDKGP